jgi:beta-galactosidase
VGGTVRLRPDKTSSVNPFDYVGAITPTLWRAPTDNDGFKLMTQHHGGGQALERWLQSGLHHGLPAGVKHTAQQSFHEDGALTVRHTFVLPDEHADPARIGVVFPVSPVFTHVRWFGLGPHENYPDRRGAAISGIWAGEPDELPYVVPQDFGLRMDCRWFELLSPAEGIVLRIEPLIRTIVNCSATWHTDDDLYRAADQTELVRRDFLTVHVDAATRGLGTGSCGPDVLPAYRIAPGTYRLEFDLSIHPLGQ